MNSDQRQGRPAEKLFNLLCSKAKITCNRSEEDDHGWDFIVEVPLLASERLPADLAGEIRKCEVQVKASETGKPVAKLSLSNARAFARSELPCFLVVVLDQNTPEPRLFIRHFWKDEITRSLKRAREAGNQGKALSKSYTQFTLTLDEERSDPIGWLTNAVRGFSRTYGAEKKEIAQSVGYEDGQWHGEVSFTLGHIQELVDHQLGLTRDLPVDFLRLSEKRFGIEATNPIFQGKPDQFRMRSLTTKDCKLVLRSCDGDSMSVPATATLPAIPNLPLEAVKVLIKTWFLEIVIANGQKIDFAANHDAQAAHNLGKLHQFFQLLAWGERGPVQFSLVGDASPLLDGHINISQSADGPLIAETARLTALLKDLSARAGADAPPFPSAAIFEAWEDCWKFYNLLNMSDAQLNGTLDGEFPEEVHPQVLIGYAELDLGVAAFLAVLEIPTESQEIKGSDMCLDLGAPLIRQCYVGSDVAVLRGYAEKSIDRHASQTDQTSIQVGNILKILT